MNMEKCSNCGADMNSKQKFCPACGADIADGGKKPPPKSGDRYDSLWILGAIGFFILIFFIFFNKNDNRPHNFQHPEMPPGQGQMPPTTAMPDLPQDYDSLVSLGNRFMDDHHYPIAIECYTKAMSIKDDDPNLLTDLGVCYHSAGELEKAVEVMERSIALDSTHMITHFNLGIVYRQMGNFDRVRFYWERLIKLYPNEAITDSTRVYLKALGG
jgi:tetratricopeptide (TPR) repeat protein